MFRLDDARRIADLPAALSATDMGYSPIWIGAAMAALQTAGFIACLIAGHLLQRWPPDRLQQHGDDGGDHRQMPISAQVERLRVLRRVRLLLRSAVLQAYVDATPPAIMGGLSIGAVRDPVVRLGVIR